MEGADKETLGTITQSDLDLLKNTKTANSSDAYIKAYKKVQNYIWRYANYTNCSTTYTLSQTAGTTTTSTAVQRNFTIDDKAKMTLNSAGTHWVSSAINVGHTGIDSYTVSLSTNGFLPSGTTVSTTPLGTDINGKTTSANTLYVNVPVNSVTQKMDFYLNFSGKYVKSVTTTTAGTKTILTPSILKYTYTNHQDIGTLTYTTTTTNVGTPSQTNNYDNATAKINLYSDSGSFSIIKTNKLNNSVIKGAEFKLFDSNGNAAKYINGTEVGTLTTDASGKITVNNLQYGTYSLVEVKTLVGYYAMSKKLVFNLTGPTTIEFVNGDTTIYSKSGTNTINVKNNPLRQSLIKKDKDRDKQTGAPITNAEIKIYDSTGTVKETISTKLTAKYFYLEPGVYTIKETITPKGYEEFKEVFKIKVLENGNIELVEGNKEYIEINGRDIIIYNQAKYITISKKDITTKEEVEGAEIVIKDKEGKEVKKFVSKKESTKIVLEPGKYTMVETISPVGYEKIETKFEFEVLEDRTVKLITINNKYIDLDNSGVIVLYNQFKKIKISKKDITNEREIEGAEIVIKDEKGNLMHKFKSTKQPEEFELQPGIYLMTETLSPKGYQKIETVFKFQVLKDGTIKLLTVNDKSIKVDKNHMIVYNTPEKVKVPNTAKNIIIYGIMGLLLVSAGGTLFYIKYKQNKQNEV